jgi:DNA uptake protein ComE-like DNA-binding protein
MTNFKSIKSLLIFSRTQRTGIFTLFTLIVVLQFVYFFIDFSSDANKSLEKEKWLSVQTEIDVLKKEKQNYVPKIYPFNPNFISDYKGYKLGMSVQEIDRLLAFRKQNKYVNSAQEFQNVTQISDSLLKSMAPYFKFPDWVKNKKQFSSFKKEDYSAFAKKEKTVLIDINKATAEDLIKIYGIGEAIAERILKQKESLGGFVAMDQLSEVWGLSPEVIGNLNKHFKVFVLPNLKKIDVNNASIKELAQFPYFKYGLAKQIVTYRSMNGNIYNIDDLTKIKGFPVDKAKIISLYLDF